MKARVERYILEIRDSRKAAYAKAYAQWIENGQVGAAPTYPGYLGWVEAQRVRLRLYELFEL